MAAACRVAFFSLAIGLLGCSSDSAGTSSTGGAGGTEAGSGGSVAGDASTDADAGPPPIDVFYASFVPETAVGEGPASLHFHNDTEFTLSFWLGQAAFVAIPAGSKVGPELSASAAVEVDTTTGKHIENACVKFPLNKYVGPAQLEPGSHYSMAVSFDSGSGWTGTLTETSGLPFVALRAKVFDPSAYGMRFSTVGLKLEGERGGRRLSWATYDQYPTYYAFAGPGWFRGTLRFVAGDGRKYASSESIELGEAPGYTIVIDDEAIPDAALVIALAALP